MICINNYINQFFILLECYFFFTRHNLLGSLQKDTMAISLHDMQQSMEEAEPSALERTVHPGQGNIHLASFSWHPAHENRLLAISQTGHFSINLYYL